MKIALLNPPWSFAGSIYFGCREPHLPLELGYCRSLLEADGHEVLMLDGAFDGLDDRRRSPNGWRISRPDLAVRHHRPDLPLLALRAARADASRRRSRRRCAPTCHCLVAIGPHGSATPRAVLDKLPVDLVVMGEAEEVVPRARERRRSWRDHAGHRVLARPAPDHRRRPAGRPLRRSARRCAGRMPGSRAHHHHHHRFEQPAGRPGRRGRGLARLPLQLQLLRQAALSRPLPPAPARHRARRRSTGWSPRA